jgi:hypothetical protein
MIEWYEQGLDWIIAHTSIEVGFIIFVALVSCAMYLTLWLMCLLERRERRKN